LKFSNTNYDLYEQRKRINNVMANQNNVKILYRKIYRIGGKNGA